MFETHSFDFKFFPKSKKQPLDTLTVLILQMLTHKSRETLREVTNVKTYLLPLKARVENLKRDRSN